MPEGDDQSELVVTSRHSERVASNGSQSEASDAAEPSGQEPAPSPRFPSCDPASAANEITAVLQRIAAHRGRPLFVLAGSIYQAMNEEIYSWRKELRAAGQGCNLDVLVDSGGGDLISCYRIARLLSRYTDDWEALVPEWAASGATLICLGSSKIVMSDIAQLGPMDPQVISRRANKLFMYERQSPLEAFQAVSYLREFSLKVLDGSMTYLIEMGIAGPTALDTATRLAVQLVQPILEKIEPYDLGAFALDSTLASEFSNRVCQPVLGSKKTQRNAEFAKLVESYPAHSFVIDITEAEAIGLNVEEPDQTLGDLFDELRPYLRQVATYVGLVPVPTPAGSAS